MEDEHLKRFLGSEQVKIHRKKVEEIGRSFEQLPDAEREFCSGLLNTIRNKDIEREFDVEQGKLEESDFEEDERAEELKLSKEIGRLFPQFSVRGILLTDYTLALLEYHRRKVKAN